MKNCFAITTYLSSMLKAQFEYWDVKGRDTEEFLQNLIYHEKCKCPTQAPCNEISLFATEICTLFTVILYTIFVL